MRQTLTLLALVSMQLALSSCGTQKEDPKVLEQVLTDYFEGIKSRDLSKLNALTTDDFVLFENGKIWTNDSLVRENPKIGKVKRDWTFDFLKVEADQEIGNMIYYNHGHFVVNDTIQRKIEWLESASFRKVNGEWKLNFLHSTVRQP